MEKAKEIRALYVCPVTNAPPPPFHLDAEPRDDLVRCCWICGQPLKVVYEDENGKRVEESR